LRAIICRGQAVVLHRLAIMSKDGDWILREDDESLAHVRRVLGTQGARYRYGTVSDVMTPVVHSVELSTPVEDVARVMRRKHIHRVIVADKGKVMGIISALDLLAVLSTKPATRSTKKK
jgi:signal-transduction protein with cAMP-binding, CBS, and nucleotidyltransferase domain